MREERDQITKGVGLNKYVIPLLQAQGRDFNKCEFCGKEGKTVVHHTKYIGATLKDLRLICQKCDKQKENQGLE